MDLDKREFVIRPKDKGIVLINRNNFINVKDAEIAGKLAYLPADATFEDAMKVIAEEACKRRVDFTTGKDAMETTHFYGLGDGRFAIRNGTYTEIYAFNKNESAVRQLAYEIDGSFKDGDHIPIDIDTYHKFDYVIRESRDGAIESQTVIRPLADKYESYVTYEKDNQEIVIGNVDEEPISLYNKLTDFSGEYKNCLSKMQEERVVDLGV